MKKTLLRSILVVLIMVFVSTLVLATDVTIIHTNDTHARLQEGGWAGMGFPKIKTLIEQKKKENANVLVLDAGDTFHGQIIANLVTGESVANVLNVVRYDAMVSGNHDFNYGQQRLLELNKMTDFPILSANIEKEDGENFLQPYTIKEMDGVKIGIIGLTTPETSYKTHPENVEGLSFTDPVQVAKTLTDKLVEKVDVIVALTHLGTNEGSKYTSKDVAEAVPKLDVIVDGHSHSVFEEGLTINGVLIVSAGEYDKNLGVVSLTIEEGKVVNKKAELITKEEASEIARDKEVLAVIEEAKAKNDEITSLVVGKTAVALNGETEAVRTQETNLGNLINDAILANVNADVSLLNGGSIRSSVDAGEITKGDVISILPFANFVVVKEINGYQLLNILEHGVSAYPATEGLFPQIGGMKFAFDPEKPAGERIKWIKVNGKQIDYSKNYTIAINDYLAVGGDGYQTLADAETILEADSLEEIVIEYIEGKGTITPEIDNRIVIVE